jgi:hypothetical protein
VQVPDNKLLETDVPKMSRILQKTKSKMRALLGTPSARRYAAAVSVPTN